MAAPIPTRPPTSIAAGDSIHFIITYANLRATDGWALKFIATGTGPQAGLKFEFDSTASGDGHECVVKPEATVLWPAGEYQLAGFAVNAGTDERTSVYLAPLNVGGPADDNDPTTHAQRMLANVEAQLEQISLHVVDESDVEGTRIKRQKLQSLTDLRDYYLGERKQEIDGERARAGLPSRRRIRTRLNVTMGGAGTNPYIGFGGSNL